MRSHYFLICQQSGGNAGVLAATSSEGSTAAQYPRETDLAAYLSRAEGDKTRWKLVWEFLEEYRWEQPEARPALLADEPNSVGDERWDVLLAALAEHLAAELDLAPPTWTELRVLGRPWFPAELPVQRTDALVHAPTAFRKHGVYLSAADLEAA